MTCELCEGLGAVVATDVYDHKVTVNNLAKETVRFSEYGEDNLFVISINDIVVVEDSEIMVLCPWCDGLG